MSYTAERLLKSERLMLTSWIHSFSDHISLFYLHYSQGDSGGPLTVKQAGQHILIGAHAGGTVGSGPRYDYSASISGHRDWIDQHISAATATLCAQ